MAAVLCSSIGKFFECLCCAPCNLCSTLPCGNPLSAFVVITVLTQAPLAVVAALDAIHVLDCRGSQWMAGMLATAIAHIAAGVYLAHRVTFATDEALRDRHTAWERISFLLCRDPLFAVYLLVVVFFGVWLCVGSSWSARGELVSGKCGADTSERVATVLGLAWFYVVSAPFILAINLCCACCDQTDYAATAEEFAAVREAREAKRQAKQKQKEKQKQTKESAEITNGNDDDDNNDSDNYNNDNDNSNPAVDIESGGDSKPPRTYSAEGIPIEEAIKSGASDSDGANIKTSIKADVLEAEAIVVEDLPPPMMPPGPETKATVF